MPRYTAVLATLERCVTNLKLLKDHWDEELVDDETLDDIDNSADELEASITDATEKLNEIVAEQEAEESGDDEDDSEDSDTDEDEA